MLEEILFTEAESSRLDKFLADRMASLSRAQIQMLIEGGKVLVDDVPVCKSSYKLESGQKVKIELPEAKQDELLAENISLDILYQDENIVVINKPAGFIVHPGAGHATGTVVNAALYRWPEMRQVGEPTRPGVVHRLDKETSGVLVLARTSEAYTWLVRQFKSRKTEKVYQALVNGHPPTPSGRIETSIGRDPRHRQRMAVVFEGHGRKAVTEYHTRKNFADYAFLDVHPITGRTHQIRVHLAYLGSPVVGDRVYGRRKPSLEIERIFLHAAKLKIILPGEKIATEFQANLPDELSQILEDLEKAE
ncbi:MAG: RluA family pseudouridine synthase [Anaerolineaceae bacterium]|jgi:23S rRNA pseudouridine1911/1915/1917 synthase